jgi:cardiolipin synthase
MPEGFWPVVILLVEFTIRLGFTAFLLLRRAARPVSTPAWIAVVLALPIAGMLAYLLVGEARLGRRRVERYRTLAQQVAERVRELPMREEERPQMPRDFEQVANLAEAVGQYGARGGNRLELLGDADVFIQSLVEDIDAAKTLCHLEFYIYLADHNGQRVAQALVNAVKRSVKCRVLVDGVGSYQFLKSTMCEQMREAGVQVVEALPANVLRLAVARLDIRNHRKIAVIDGVIAYAGSQNIADAEFAPKKHHAPWVDCMVRTQGPIVRDLHQLFIEDWYLDTDELLLDDLALPPTIVSEGMTAQVIGTGPTTYNEAMHELLQAAIHSAREEIILTTPYFVPDEATQSSIRTAARRGVATTLIVPARNDSRLVAAASRGNYESLLESGVRIAEYRKGLLHSKTMTVDRSIALVTSANLDRRSFELNFEVSLVVYDSDFASQLRFMQTAYLELSDPIDAIAWRNRPWPTRLAQNAAGMLSPLL